MEEVQYVRCPNCGTVHHLDDYGEGASNCNGCFWHASNMVPADIGGAKNHPILPGIDRTQYQMGAYRT